MVSFIEYFCRRWRHGLALLAGGGLFYAVILVQGHRPPSRARSFSIFVPAKTASSRKQHRELKAVLERNTYRQFHFFYTDPHWLAQGLVSAGLIRSAYVFKGIARRMDLINRIRPGVYRFNGNESPREIMTKLIQGEVVFLYLFIRPGRTLSDIAVDLRGNFSMDITPEDRQTATKWIRDKYGIEVDSPEGFLYPGVYFQEGKTRSIDFIMEALERFDEEVGQSFREAGQTGKLLEVLIEATHHQQRLFRRGENPICTPDFIFLMDAL